MSNIAGIHLSFGNETGTRILSRRPQMSELVVDWSCFKNSIGRWIGPFFFWVVWVVLSNVLARIVRNVDESLSVS
jgi:hypothetical protein